MVRRRTPVLLQVYLPSGLFVIVSWISFIVPPEVVPGKVSSVPSLLSSPGRVPGNSPPTLSIYCLLPSSSILKTFISISENFFLRSFLNYLNAELHFSTSFLRSPIRYWPLVSRLCTHWALDRYNFDNKILLFAATCGSAAWEVTARQKHWLHLQTFYIVFKALKR